MEAEKTYTLVEKRLKKLGLKPEELMREFETRDTGKKSGRIDKERTDEKSAARRVEADGTERQGNAAEKGAYGTGTFTRLLKNQGGSNESRVGRGGSADKILKAGSA
ncbi:MAG: hypothetical protein V1717_01770 [Candidatus Micrarchaeota archaeon]